MLCSVCSGRAACGYRGETTAGAIAVPVGRSEVCLAMRVSVGLSKLRPACVPLRALMKMDAELLHSPVVGLAEEEEADMNDWNLPLAFMKKRHSEKIEGSKALAQSWRMKDRVRGRLFTYLSFFIFYLKGRFFPKVTSS